MSAKLFEQLGIELWQAKRSNPSLKKRLLRYLRLLAMTFSSTSQTTPTVTLLLTFLVINIYGTLASAQPLEKYQPVTNERLLHPEPQNWLMYRGTYDSWGYSPLDQINRKNVRRLVPVWTFSTGVGEGHQSPP